MASSSRYLRPDGFYVVDGEVPLATKAERAIIDRVISKYGAMTRRSSLSTKVPWSWGISFEAVESRGDPNARSPVPPSRGGPALGLMQIMPATFRMYRPGASEAQMLDPATNIQVGMEYLAKSRAKGLDVAEAASVYNAGGEAGSGKPHPADNPWGMRMERNAAGYYADQIVRAYNYVTARTLRVMLRGDSIMVGAAPYVVAACAGLPVEFVGRFGSSPVLHEAVVGESIAKIGVRLGPSMDAVGPVDVIVEMAGTNDVSGGAAPDVMARAETGALLADAQYASAVVAVAIPPQPGASAARRGVPAAYKRALEEQIARTGKPIVLIDAGLTDADMGPDGVHPLTPGLRKLGDSIADAIAKISGLTRDVEVPGAARPWYLHPVALAVGIGAAGFGVWRLVR